jgi:hypothetical protein
VPIGMAGYHFRGYEAVADFKGVEVRFSAQGDWRGFLDSAAAVN